MIKLEFILHVTAVDPEWQGTSTKAIALASTFRQILQTLPAVQEGVTNAAADLGLLDSDADPDRLLLLQLPSLLPVPASSLAPSRRQGLPLKPLNQPQACSLSQLPSGKVSLSVRCASQAQVCYCSTTQAISFA